MPILLVFALGFCVLLLAACSDGEPVWHEEEGYRWAEVSPGFWGKAGFARVPASRTGISFQNRLTEEEIATNRIYLNGSGVAAGDVDDDGRVDLYFARLNGPNRLYRNLGGWAFEDITEAAGVAHEGHYSTGVTFADVTGNGHLDLLVGSVHQGVTLYRNDGTGRFAPVPASESGLASTEGKGTTTLALADIDGNGYLDLYVTNYREHSINDLVEMRELTWESTVEESEGEDGPAYSLRSPFDEYYTIIDRANWTPVRREIGERDQLFLNDGSGGFTEADPLAHFLDAEGAPVGLDTGWGLAASFQDLNGDGLPDLYVCNDFWTPDRVWMNQGNGIFRELPPYAVRNFSFSSMAVDFSDINRDGSPDIFVTEMLSPLHERRIRHLVPEGPYPDIRFWIDGQPLYNRNSLYVNRGDGTFAETAYHAGVEASGWSWATRFLDVDLDGYEDLLVATGFSYDFQDLDTQLRMNREIVQGVRASRGHLVEYPPLELVNKAFRNNGDLTFADASAEWGFTEEDISHALTVADLDGDGDLDLVFNRLNAEAAVYESTTSASRIGVRLTGRPPNTRAVGARIELEGGPVAQTEEVAAGGAYLSSSDPLAVFAADPNGPGHTIRVTWPNGGRSTVGGVEADRVYEIREPDQASPRPTAGAEATEEAPSAQPMIFEDVSDRLDHAHHEARFDDWGLQPLVPVALSRQGPGVSWIDLDGDGRDDLLVASGRGAPLTVFKNLGDGGFAPLELDPLDSPAPGDQTTILGWADRDGTTLLIGSQNLEQGNVGAPAAFRYSVTDDGVAAIGTVPDNLAATGPLAAADYTGNGELDLFVGGRFIPGRYPADAGSRLFRSEDGRFVPDEANTDALVELGMVVGAVFTDFDGDGHPDLVVSTEWGSPRLFRNDGGRFRDVSEEVGLSSYTGWWQGIATGDFDNDGRPDIVAANRGWNSPYRPLPDRPLRMYLDDFNFDGRVDVIESYYDPVSDAYVPRRQLHEYESIWTSVPGRFRTHREFAAATLPDILAHRAGTTPFREAAVLGHTVFLNRGDRFVAQPLPMEAQLSAGFAVAVADYDHDGNEDLFLSQNLFSVRPGLPRQDAGRGVWLKGDGQGGFEALPGQVSGIAVYGEQRGAAVSDFDADGRVDLVVTQNAGPTKLYLNRSPRRGLRVRLRGPESNRDAIGSSLRLLYTDGTRGPLREIQAGSGYWSQNSTTQVLGSAPGKEVSAIQVGWFDGTSRTVDVSDTRTTYVIDHRE